MADNASDPYVAVLADLHAKRDQIDQTIGLLVALREGRASAPAPAPASVISPTEIGEEDRSGEYLGMSIVDASKKLLAMRKRAMGNADILAELRSGGLVLTSADPVNVISSVLMRRFKSDGDIVRVDRGVWGLKEWYPGRTFKAPPKPQVSSGPAVTTPFVMQFNDLGGVPTEDDDV